MLTEEDLLLIATSNLLLIATSNAKRSGQLPKLTVKNHEGIQRVVLDHECFEVGKFLLMDGLGIGDSHFFDALMTQLAAACAVNGNIDKNALNDTLSTIISNGPRTRNWVALCDAMAAVHRNIVALALILASCKDRGQQDRVKAVARQIDKNNYDAPGVPEAPPHRGCIAG